MFNNHYINTVEKKIRYCTRKSWRFPFVRKWWRNCINKISKHYENHPSVSKLKCNQIETLKNFPVAKAQDTNKIIKSFNPSGPDGITVKILKIARNAFDSDVKFFSEDATTGLVKPLNKNDRHKSLKSYRPVSILNGFSKVYERYLLNSLYNHIEKILSNFIAANRKI